jgi:hypothetical protein
VFCAVSVADLAVVDDSPQRAQLVPHTLFYRIPAHVRRLNSIAEDLRSGHKHILLMGNQVAHSCTVIKLYFLSPFARLSVWCACAFVVWTGVNRARGRISWWTICCKA